MRFFGHPLHPMLVHFPLAFWTLAAAAYVAAIVGIGQQADWIARAANGVALAMALPAMAAGLLELSTIDSNGASFRVATTHMMVMASVWILFLLALVVPMASTIAHRSAEIAATICAVAGFLALALGGWLGGRLDYEFGTGMKQRHN